MSGGIAGATPLEEQIDDVRAMLDTAGSDQPALISFAEGCALAVLFATSQPHVVRALVSTPSSLDLALQTQLATQADG
jgi:pimeloyl-ACP methyl ester carboxylesterase